MGSRSRALVLAVATLALVLLAGACGGDGREDPSAAERPAAPSSPLVRGAEKATLRADVPVGVVVDRNLGKTFYVLTIENNGTLPHVWGDLRETPRIPPHVRAHTPGIERDGTIWRYAVSPGNGASISFFTPLD